MLLEGALLGEVLVPPFMAAGVPGSLFVASRVLGEARVFLFLADASIWTRSKFE